MTERLWILIDENAVSKVQEHIEDAIQKVEQFYMVVKGYRARWTLYSTNCNWISE